MLVNKSEPVAIHKVGMKHLFQLDQFNQSQELDAFCCLDFYVREPFQRKGLGRLLFEIAEQVFGVRADYWAFDRPSPKLKAFLRKYYRINADACFDASSRYSMAPQAVSVAARAFKHLNTECRLGRISERFDSIVNTTGDHDSQLRRAQLVKQFMQESPESLLPPMFSYLRTWAIPLDDLSMGAWESWFLLQTRSAGTQPAAQAAAQDVAASAVEAPPARRELPGARLRNAPANAQPQNQQQQRRQHQKTAFW